MSTTYHDQLTGSDLHANKIDPTTGTELTLASQIIYDARYPAKAATDAHIASTSNPHATTAAQVGAPTSGQLTAHTGDMNNPHSVTAAQAGAPPISRSVATTAPLTGGGDLSADLTIALPVATSLIDGYLRKDDWATFNNKAFRTALVIGPSGSTGNDYTGNGTSDQTAFNSALAALKAVGGGKLLVRAGTYTLTGRIYTDTSNITIEGAVEGACTILINWTPSVSAGSNGAVTFYSDSITPIKNIHVKNLVFDHNGYKTVGVLLRGNTSNAVTSRGFSVEGCEFLNRGGDNSGSLACIVIQADYGSATGSMQNVAIKNCLFHDNTATSGDWPYSILILSNSLEDFTLQGCQFRDLYGTTIGLGATAIRTRKNWHFVGNRFYNTKLGTLGTGTTCDIFDSSRKGFVGIRIVDNHFEDNQSFTISEDKFHLAVYNSSGFICSNNSFYYSRCVIAPGQSSPPGNESFGWTFSNNLMIDTTYFSDFDGHYAGTYDNNIFVRNKYGSILGGYGNHFPSNYTNNLFYNCCSTPDTSQEYTQAIFLIEDGGNVVANNTIYNDSSVTGMKYVFAELNTSGSIANPNIYKNNTLLGIGPSGKTFYLDASYQHVIQGNTGVLESVIQNALSHATPGVSALSASDIVTDNFKANGDPLTNPQYFGGKVGVGTTSPSAKLSVSEKARIFDSTPTNADSSTDVGYLFGATVSSGLITEVSGQIASVGINMSQFGTQDNARSGGIIRLDTRSGVNQLTVISHSNVSGTQRDRLTVSLNTGDTNLTPFGGNTAIGQSTVGNSTLQVAGSIATALATKTATYSLTATDSVILADATSGAFTVTLPTAVGCQGRQYTIKRVNSSANAVTIASVAGNIDGVATKVLSAQWQMMRVVSDGANWFVV